MSGTLDDWDDRPHSCQGIDGMFLSRKEAALKRENALAYSFSNQVSSLSSCVHVPVYFFELNEHMV